MEMQKVLLGFKQEVLGNLIKGKITRKQTAHLLKCTRQTIYRYLQKVAKSGLGNLKDKRHSNNYKLSRKQEGDLLIIKKQGRWRSARKAQELTGIAHVSPRRVQQIWVKHNLHLENIERLKPIVRFVAKYPNELWQADIQGKLHFPYLGNAYLILVVDDHSRFSFLAVSGSLLKLR